MAFLEADVQGSDHICRDLMDDLVAIEDESDDSREFTGNAHTVVITPAGVVITRNPPDCGTESDDSTVEAPFNVPLKHFREILEDWEAFILDDQIDDPMADEDYV